MASTVGLFCPHKRLRTACRDCTPEFAPPSALVVDDDALMRPRRRR